MDCCDSSAPYYLYVLDLIRKPIKRGTKGIKLICPATPIRRVTENLNVEISVSIKKQLILNNPMDCCPQLLKQYMPHFKAYQQSIQGHAHADLNIQLQICFVNSSFNNLKRVNKLSVERVCGSQQAISLFKISYFLMFMRISTFRFFLSPLIAVAEHIEFILFVALLISF